MILRRFVFSHLLIPTTLFLFVVVVFEYYGFDLKFAEWIYQFGDNAWQFKNTFWLSSVFHDGGRIAVGIGFLLLLLKLLLSTFKPNVEIHSRRALGLLLGSVAVTVIIVSALKHLTHIGCPWDYIGFGGSAIYRSMFYFSTNNDALRACFPAGHASAGYAWVALYYYFSAEKTQKRWYGLAFGIVLGLIFDITQQLRGAHFASHGLWTAWIAWSVASLGYMTTIRNSESHRLKTGNKESA